MATSQIIHCEQLPPLDCMVHKLMRHWPLKCEWSLQICSCSYKRSSYWKTMWLAKLTSAINIKSRSSKRNQTRRKFCQDWCKAKGNWKWLKPRIKVAIENHSLRGASGFTININFKNQAVYAHELATYKWFAIMLTYCRPYKIIDNILVIWIWNI